MFCSLCEIISLSVKNQLVSETVRLCACTGKEPEPVIIYTHTLGRLSGEGHFEVCLMWNCVCALVFSECYIYSMWP